MSTQPDPPERTARGTPGAATRLPAIARYWWLTALRGLVALTLALAIAVGDPSTARLVAFLALFWMTGGLITLRFALAIRPRPGFRLGLAAAIAAVVGRRWYCFATGSPGSSTPRCSWGCWASPRCSRACCGSWAGSPPKSGWDAAGHSAGSCYPGSMPDGRAWLALLVRKALVGAPVTADATARPSTRKLHLERAVGRMPLRRRMSPRRGPAFEPDCGPGRRRRAAWKPVDLIGAHLMWVMPPAGDPMPVRPLPGTAPFPWG